MPAVLLVDDVPEVRVVLRQALRLSGDFDVVGEAHDGAGAIEQAGRLHPDIVVLDLGLPDLAGRDVLAGLRQASPSSRVVVFTGTDQPDRSVMRAEADAFVTKDSEIDYLVDLLQRLTRAGDRAAVCALARRPEEVATARHFLERRCAAWECEALVADAALIASELVTNAIVHAGSRAELRAKYDGRILRLEIEDQGQGSPDVQLPTPTDEHGRGLLLVSALSTAWGVEQYPDGTKVVWAELSLPAH